MAFMQYLNFNGTDLPLPDSYDIDLSDVEADSSGETEAGTTQRDVVRSGVVKIAVSFSVSPVWLKKADGIFQTAEDNSSLLRYRGLSAKGNGNVYQRF